MSSKKKRLKNQIIQIGCHKVEPPMPPKRLAFEGAKHLDMLERMSPTPRLLLEEGAHMGQPLRFREKGVGDHCDHELGRAKRLPGGSPVRSGSTKQISDAYCRGQITRTS